MDHKVVKMNLGETVFQDLPRPSHPLPPLVGIDWGIGLQANAAPGELDDDSRDIPSVLIYMQE